MTWTDRTHLAVVANFFDAWTLDARLSVWYKVGMYNLSSSLDDLSCSLWGLWSSLYTLGVHRLT
jgi:hypothetical protein